jgi:NitT/TauT family transport system ATP-binding protein
MITHDIEEAIYLSQRLYVLSSRPGRVRGELTIPLPEQREIDIKLSSEFMEIKRKVIHLLKTEYSSDSFADYPQKYDLLTIDK